MFGRARIGYLQELDLVTEKQLFNTLAGAVRVKYDIVMVYRIRICQGIGEGSESMQLRTGLVRRILKEAEALFLAVQNSSIGDLVTDSLTH